MRSIASKGVEILYRYDGEPVEAYPRFCVDETLITSTGAPCLRGGVPLHEQMERKPDSKICFYRSHALGDILLLTPIFNWLKEEYPACEIILATGSRFMSLFRYWDAATTIDKRSVLHCDYDVGYYLDGLLEEDHKDPGKSHKHRLNLYCEFLDIPIPKDPVFSLPYGEDEKRWAESIVGTVRNNGKPIVVMQLFGSTQVKQFKRDKVMRIAGALSYQYSVILVHNYPERPVDIDATDLTGKTTVHQLAALIDISDAVVTMDSGVLWVAHCTQTPVIVMLGPTREEERLTYHRNYHVVNLSKMVGCEPCFERQTHCKGAINCMNRSSEEAIIEEIQKGVLKLVSS